MENKITFDFTPANRVGKEDYEWLRCWCEEVNDTSLPRVALVGDSITEGYFGLVRAGLKGVAQVDYLATSYAVNTTTFKKAVSAFLSDSDYKVIHFNNGLHGYHVTAKDYEKSIEDFLLNYADKSKIVIATVTEVYTNGLEKINPDWVQKVRERNDAVKTLAKKHGWGLSDMYSAMPQMPKSSRNADGVHFNEDGYKTLANIAINAIKTQI
jgi:hypothetical protein